MLKDPDLDIPYQPTVSWLLAGIEIYYREETLGEELCKYNPNDKKDREEIIKKYILPEKEHLSYRHRFLLIEELKSCLQQSDYDFERFFDPYITCEDHTSIAWDNNEIDSPRSFFEDIYRYAWEEWKEDLQKAASEDPTTW
ncbi:hypothetical protein [Pseudomonas rhizoryzae]|uniref:hypothetical protein n=1 Tax=Pseudomonas rhizoryzae TaxID=2571129 RepID=UPI0009C050AE|nr:hypothetical protein [Pseudomonas rhizoryzae]